MNGNTITFEEFEFRCNCHTFDKWGNPKHTKHFRDLYINFADKLLEKYNLDLYRCNNPKCGIYDWLGYPILFKGELHHRNGITNDSRFINIGMYCSNCHVLTKGYKGRSVDTEMAMEIMLEREIFI